MASLQAIEDMLLKGAWSFLLSLSPLPFSSRSEQFCFSMHICQNNAALPQAQNNRTDYCALE